MVTDFSFDDATRNINLERSIILLRDQLLLDLFLFNSCRSINEWKNGTLKAQIKKLCYWCDFSVI